MTYTLFLLMFTKSLAIDCCQFVFLVLISNYFQFGKINFGLTLYYTDETVIIFIRHKADSLSLAWLQWSLLGNLIFLICFFIVAIKQIELWDFKFWIKFCLVNQLLLFNFKDLHEKYLLDNLLMEKESFYLIQEFLHFYKDFLIILNKFLV